MEQIKESSNKQAMLKYYFTIKRFQKKERKSGNKERN